MADLKVEWDLSAELQTQFDHPDGEISFFDVFAKQTEFSSKNEIFAIWVVNMCV